MFHLYLRHKLLGATGIQISTLIICKNIQEHPNCLKAKPLKGFKGL